MSVDGIKWCIEVNKRTDLHPRAAKVALVLGNRHNGKTGQCTPGQWCIFDEAGVSRRTAQYALHDLRDAGLIDIQRRPRPEGGRGSTSNSYELLPINGVAPRVWEHHPEPDLDWVGGEANETPTKAQPVTQWSGGTKAQVTAQRSTATNAQRMTTNAQAVVDQCNVRART
jgi:hypothetical protein